ncbi:hypothetical protein PIB30_078139 [Stylosanthes scabra]|uniref:Uncharacterized protein n=1 Tax=Stylosanthes scabra TaxID=79078 RepID=A0ABU6WP25_9FABA|nr:hypothetical protein [Stylosanthes scabra]
MTGHDHSPIWRRNPPLQEPELNRRTGRKSVGPAGFLHSKRIYSKMLRIGAVGLGEGCSSTNAARVGGGTGTFLVAPVPQGMGRHWCILGDTELGCGTGVIMC